MATDGSPSGQLRLSLDVNGLMKRYFDRHSPADGTLPEVPAADYTASIASLEGLFRTTETSSAHRRTTKLGERSA